MRGATSGEQFVCARCFDDYAIQDFINANAEHGECSFCGQRNIHKSIAASGADVLSFILRGIESEYSDVDSEAVPFDSEEDRFIVPVYGIWDMVREQHTDISSNDDVLSWIISSFIDRPPWCERDPMLLSPEDGLISGWQDFCAAVKHRTRYLFFDPHRRTGEPGEEPHLVHPSELLEQIASAVKTADLIRELPAGTAIFRARPHEIGAQYSAPAELGPPDEDSAKAGRMNAAGIVVFYGALEESTAVAETAKRKPGISIGTFELIQPMRVLDLIDLPPIPSIFDEAKTDLRLPLRFLHHFQRDISEPITPDDRIHIEYTPTQVVSEFIKLRFSDQEGRRVSGVLYPSSRRHNGANVVLFATKDNIEGVPSQAYPVPEKLLRLRASRTISSEEEIRLRAYLLYAKAGKRYGHQLEDWLQAEAEILGGST